MMSGSGDSTKTEQCTPSESGNVLEEVAPGGQVYVSATGQVRYRGATLLLLQCPEAYCDEQRLKSHFDQVTSNQVVGVQVRPQKRSALIQFQSQRAAALALRRGATVDDGSIRLRLRYYIPPGARASLQRWQALYQQSSAQSLNDGRTDEREAQTFAATRTQEQPATNVIQRLANNNAAVESESPSNIPGSFHAVTSSMGWPNRNQKPAAGKTFSDPDDHVQNSGSMDVYAPAPVARLESGEHIRHTEREQVPQAPEVSLSNGAEATAETAPLGHAGLVGTCLAMCPLEEQQQRQVQRDVHFFEMSTDTNGTLQPNPQIMVKKFARPAAGAEAVRPEQVRPPAVLRQTMEYLLQHIADREDVPFHEVYAFLRDRTRSIRQDFTYQGIYDTHCVWVHEHCVRFHIMAEHRFAGAEPQVFSSKQNMEQLEKCLLALRHLYREANQRGEPFISSQSEFEAYYLLMQSRTDPLVTALRELDSATLNSESVVFALRVMLARQRADFRSFFGPLLEQATYLQACMMHRHFGKMRLQALVQLARASSRHEVWPIAELVRLLAFDDTGDAIRFLENCGLATTPDGKGIELGAQETIIAALMTKSMDATRASQELLRPSLSRRSIECKAMGLKPSEIIRGKSPTVSLEQQMRERIAAEIAKRRALTSGKSYLEVSPLPQSNSSLSTMDPTQKQVTSEAFTPAASFVGMAAANPSTSAASQRACAPSATLGAASETSVFPVPSSQTIHGTASECPNAAQDKSRPLEQAEPLWHPTPLRNHEFESALGTTTTSLDSTTTTPSRTEAPTRDTRPLLFSAEAPRAYLVEPRRLAADAPTASFAASMHGTVGPGHPVQESHAAPLRPSNTASSGSKLAVQSENRGTDREWSASDTTNSFLPAPLQGRARSRTRPGASSETGSRQTENDGVLSGSTIVPSEPKPLSTGSSEALTHHEQTREMSVDRAHAGGSTGDETRTNAPSEAPLVATPMPLESMSTTDARPTGIEGAPEFTEIPETLPRTQPASVEFRTPTEEKVTTMLPTASSPLEKEQADPLSDYRTYLAQREVEHDRQVEDALEQLDQEWIQVRHAPSHAIESLVPVGLALEQIIAQHRAKRTALERAPRLQLEALTARLDQVDKAVSELAQAASRLVEVARPNSNGALRARRLARQIRQYQQQIQEAYRASQTLTQQAAQIEARRELHERMMNQLVFQTKPVAASAILPPRPAADATALHSRSKTLSSNTEWRTALETSHDQGRRHIQSEACARIGVWWPSDQQLCIRFAQALWQQTVHLDENEFLLRSDAGTLQLSTVLQDIDGLLVLLPAQSTHLDTLPVEAVAVIGNRASCRGIPLLVLLVDGADAPRGTRPGIVLVYENREYSFGCFCVSVDHAGDSVPLWSWFTDKLRSRRHRGFETPMLPLSIILLQLSDHLPTGAPTTVDPAIHNGPRPWSVTAARWTSWALKIRSLVTKSSSSRVDQFMHIANVTEECVARLVQATTNDLLNALPAQRLPAWIAQQLEELDATSILVPSNLWPDAVGYPHHSPTNHLGESEWTATPNPSEVPTPAAVASTPPPRWQQLQQKISDELQSLHALKERLLETLNPPESKQKPRAA